jgi:Tfp pilus assembly major pilin PilA
MFKKKENGFSLVELSVAAAVAVGLAVVAVAVVSGTATSVSAKGSSAASVESCTISESLAKAGGDVAANSCTAPTVAPGTIVFGTDLHPTQGISSYQWMAEQGNPGNIQLYGLSAAAGNAAVADIIAGKTKLTFTSAVHGTYTANVVDGPSWANFQKYQLNQDTYYGGYTLRIFLSWNSFPGGVNYIAHPYGTTAAANPYPTIVLSN